MAAALLFDLDGCLVDSLPMIRSCWERTLPRFGAPAPSPERARELAGPPAPEVARALLPDASPERLDEVLAAYRRCAAESVGEVHAFPGVSGTLDALRERGIRLAVATSRAQDIAEPILASAGLRDRFDVVHGPGAHELAIDKATVVGRALSDLADLGAGDALGLVGDRAHDVLGAHAHGLRCLGALWGYGGREELATAGADALLDAPEDLLATVAAPVRS